MGGSSTGISVPISMNKQEWINNSIHYLYDNIPKSVLKSDFSDITEIKQSQDKVQIIIDRDLDSKIKVILEALKVIKRFFVFSLSLDHTKLPPKEIASMNFCVLSGYITYIQQHVFQSLYGQEDGVPKKTALLHLWGRVFGFAQSLTKLDSPRDAYPLTASLRMLLELYVDMVLIRDDIIENAVDKFFAHPDLHKYKTAPKLIEIDKELGRPISESSELIKYETIPSEEKKKIRDFWNISKPPNHWSGLHLEDRARKAKCLDIYRHVYHYGNIFIHSGYVKFPSNEKESHMLCAHVYGSSSDLLSKSTKMICDFVIPSKSSQVKEDMDKFIILGDYNLWNTHYRSDK